MLTIFLRFLRLNRRNGGNNNNNFPLIPGRYKNKLQTIKDILNSEEFAQEEGEDDYRTEDDVLSKENDTGTMYMNNPFNSTEATEEFVENLLKLIKIKSKKW